MAVAMWLLSGVYLGSRFGFGFHSLYCPSSGTEEVSFKQGFVCHGENKHVVCLMAESLSEGRGWRLPVTEITSSLPL